VRVPTLDIISTERNVIGNIVGTYTDLSELMALAQAGRVVHTRTYPRRAPRGAFRSSQVGYCLGPWVKARPEGIRHWCQPGRS
jgi:NAD+-dependent secondary alcohol dehydrogenase Adh1